MSVKKTYKSKRIKTPEEKIRLQKINRKKKANKLKVKLSLKDKSYVLFGLILAGGEYIDNDIIFKSDNIETIEYLDRLLRRFSYSFTLNNNEYGIKAPLNRHFCKSNRIYTEHGRKHASLYITKRINEIGLFFLIKFTSKYNSDNQLILSLPRMIRKDYLKVADALHRHSISCKVVSKDDLTCIYVDEDIVNSFLLKVIDKYKLEKSTTYKSI